ncbi:PH domain-containing protein [Catenuloplanes japonicus]|uniref:PH domain-containing protein n=1 Tax=Catenuloplanes japonicus TaxID=33876 RepID=UPI0005265E23|nr:PH domain-containing protein [Catenuloplanes japonicus]
MSSRSTVIRYRQSGPLAIAAGLATVGALGMPAANLWLAPVVLVPLSVAVWAARSGTDAGPTGLRVRALLGSRHIPWADVAEIAPGERGRVFALLTDGTVIRLTGVTARALPDLLKAGQQTLAADSEIPK